MGNREGGEVIDPDDHGYSEEMTVTEAAAAIGCVVIATLFVAAIIIGAIYSAWRAFTN